MTQPRLPYARVLQSLFVALATVALALGCVAPTASTTTQCPTGQHAVGTSCAYDAVIITIGPGQMGGAFTTNCPTFSPNPASTRANQVVQWTNNTTGALTVYRSTGTPLVTVNPGQTSGGIYWSTAGNIAYGVGTCSGNGTSYSQYYGAISVTVN